MMISVLPDFPLSTCYVYSVTKIWNSNLKAEMLKIISLRNVHKYPTNKSYDGMVPTIRDLAEVKFLKTGILNSKT